LNGKTNAMSNTNSKYSTKEEFKSGAKNTIGKGQLADVAILSLADFERIRKNATILTKEEEKKPTKNSPGTKRIKIRRSKGKKRQNSRNRQK